MSRCHKAEIFDDDDDDDECSDEEQECIISQLSVVTSAKVIATIDCIDYID